MEEWQGWEGSQYCCVNDPITAMSTWDSIPLGACEKLQNILQIHPILEAKTWDIYPPLSFRTVPQAVNSWHFGPASLSSCKISVAEACSCWLVQKQWLLREYERSTSHKILPRLPEAFDTIQVPLYSLQDILWSVPYFLLSPFPRLPSLTLMCPSLTNLTMVPRTHNAIATSMFVLTVPSSMNIHLCLPTHLPGIPQLFDKIQLTHSPSQVLKPSLDSLHWSWTPCPTLYLSLQTAL